MKNALSIRGQSEVIGAILIFGILILFLGLLQMYLVPQIVADTEQNHVEQIENDFTGISTAISDAAGSNSDRSAALTLGTRNGVFATLLLPPPASGSLHTEDVGNLSGDGGVEFDNENLMSDLCGLNSVESKSLHYEGNYNEYRDAGEYTYETGLNYKRINGRTLQQNQRLLIQNEAGTITTINLVPITHGSIHESGTTTRSLSFEPGITGQTHLFSGNENNPVNITIDAYESDAWNDIVGNSEIVNPSSDSVTLTLDNESHQYRIRCTPIGINTSPENEPANEFQDDDDEQEEEDSGAVNPIGEGQLILESSDPEELVFNNTAPTEKTVTDVRIPWAFSVGSGGDDYTLTFDEGPEVIATVPGTEWESTGGWTWPALNSANEDHIKNITVSGTGKNNDGYAVVFKFDDGTTNTYLVSGGPGNSGSN